MTVASMVRVLLRYQGMFIENVFFFVAFCMSTVLCFQINSAQGAEPFIDLANVTLSQIDKNLTSTMINTSLTQINDSRTSDSEDSAFNLEMAKRTVQDLINGLSYKSDHKTFDLGDTDQCQKHPTDCIILRLQFALNRLNTGDLQIADQTLSEILHNLK